ncbi:MAG TPA: PAS domain S-box protein [Methanospirillum sp.]|nr:PAS domain S-box protein [Methanospirillum sp.]
MTNKEDPAQSLRDDAEDQLTRTPRVNPDLPEKTPEEIIHELRVHQIELEIQSDELKKAYQDLEVSRDRYINLYDFAPVGYVTLTDKALIAEVNLTGATMLRVDRKTLIQDRFRRFIAPQDQESFDHFFLGILQSGIEQICELHIRRKDGTDFIAWMKGFLEVIDDGSQQVRILLNDRTESNRIETLTRVNQYQRSLIEASIDPFIIIGPDGTITDVNIATVQVTGRSREYLIGTDFVDYCTNPEKARAGFQLVYEKGQVRDYPLELSHLNGNTTPILYNASVYSDEWGNGAGIFVVARDITERLKAEDALKERDIQNQALFDQSPIAIELYDSMGTLVQANPACLNLFGIEDIRSIQRFSLFADPNVNDAQKDRLHRGETVHYQGPFDFEKVKNLRLYPTIRDGIIWLDVLITPLTNDAGSITGFLTQIQDITGRKQAEKEIITSEIRYRRLFESAQDGILILNHKTGEVTDSNPFIETLTGYSKEELIGKSLWEIGFIKDTIASKVAFEELQAKDYIRYDDLPLETKDGKRIDVEFVSNVYPIDANTSVIQCNIRDISDRYRAEEAMKAAEETYRTIFLNSQIGLFRTDAKTGLILDANDAVARFIGYPDRISLLAEPFDITERYIDPSDREKMLALLQVEGEFQNVETRFLKNDGSIIWMRFSAKLIPDKGWIEGISEDITDRKRAEEELYESETKLNLALSGAETGMWELNLSSNAGTIDDRAADLLGYKPDDVGAHYTDWDQLSHPDDIPLIHQRLSDYLAGLTSMFESEHRMRHASGDWIWVIGKGKIIQQFPDGTPARISGTIQNISRRKRMEEAVKESEKRYRDMFEINTAVMLIINPEDSSIIDANAAAIRYYGYTKEEFSHLPLGEINIDNPDIIQKRILQALDRQGIVFEFHHRKKNGEIRDVEVFSGPITIGGRKILHSIIQDITDRKRAEQELITAQVNLKEAHRQAHIGTFEWDIETDTVTWSDELYTIAGRDSSFPAPTYTELPSYYTPASWDRLSGAVARALTTKEPFYIELEMVRPDGSIRWTNAFAGVTSDLKGNVIGFNGTVQDFTERKQAEDAIHESNQKLRLLTGLTRHDILNQVTAVKLLQDLALDTSNPAKVTEYITRAQEAVDQIEATIGFTREYENFGVVSSGWQRICRIIKSAKTEVSLGSVTVGNTIPEEIEVYADPIIRKVFTTLMENAIRHGGDLSNIRFLCSEREDTLIVICEDDGVGVSSEEKEYIFDHGYGKHTGIGLFLAREILSITGLSIQECGEPGIGARFEILVPAGKYRRISG